MKLFNCKRFSRPTERPTVISPLALKCRARSGPACTSLSLGPSSRARPYERNPWRRGRSKARCRFSARARRSARKRSTRRRQWPWPNRPLVSVSASSAPWRGGQAVAPSPYRSSGRHPLYRLNSHVARAEVQDPASKTKTSQQCPNNELLIQKQSTSSILLLYTAVNSLPQQKR